MPKLTPEELHLKRSLAAKKAAQTLKAHELADPEFHERMQTIRLSNLAKGLRLQKRQRELNPEEYHKMASARSKKAAETVRRRRAEDPGYNMAYLEKQRIGREKAKWTREAKKEEEKRRQREEEEDDYYDWLYEERKQKEELEDFKKEAEKEAEDRTQEEPPSEPYTYEPGEDYTPDQETYDFLPHESDNIISTLESILNSAVNVNTASYLRDAMYDSINEQDGETYDEQITNFILSIYAQKDELISLATEVAFEPSDQDNLIDAAESFLALINGGTPDFPLSAGLEECVSEDIPFNNRKATRAKTGYYQWRRKY